MADTDLTPFDQGTFGSRTTPAMAPQIARAAADGARAADRSGGRAVDRSTAPSLRADGGRVLAGDGRGIALDYGDLVAGQAARRARDARPPPDPRLEAPRHAGQEGQRPRHRHRPACMFTPDLVRPTHAVRPDRRPPAYGATGRSIDDSVARAIAGVTVVRDGDLHRRRRADRARAHGARPQRSGSNGRKRAGSRPRRTSTTISSAPRARRVRPAAEAAVRRVSRRRRARPRGVGEARRGIVSHSRTSRTSRSSRAPPSPSGPTTRSRSGPARSGRSACGPKSRTAFGIPKIACASSCPTWARATAASTPASRPSKRRGSRGPRPAGEARLRPRRRVHVGLLPAGGRDRRQGRRRRRWHGSRSGSSTTTTPAPRACRRRTSSPNQRVAFHAADSPLRQGSYRGLAATANHYAREMHMDALARAAGHRRGRVPPEAHLDDAADARGARRPPRRRSAGRAPARGRPRARQSPAAPEKGSYVATAAEVGSSLRSNGAARRLHRHATRRRLRVRRHRQSRRPAQSGRRCRSFRAWAARCSRPSIRQRPDPERVDGAVSRAALQGRAADRRRAARIDPTCRRPAPARRRSSASRRRLAVRCARLEKWRPRCRYR